LPHCYGASRPVREIVELIRTMIEIILGSLGLKRQLPELLPKEPDVELV